MPITTKADLFEPELARLAQWAQAMSHPARLSILQILAKRDACICGELVDELPLSQASVSRHLKTLKEAGLIKGEIDGPRVCYCLDYEAIGLLKEQLEDFAAGFPDAPGGPTCC